MYRLTKYVPHAPTPKQAVFLMAPHKEVFYGGAAGGGKSDAILMAALQYVDVPKYAAIVFRRTLADAKQPNSVMMRSHDWLQGSDAKWHAQDYYWSFPSGAVLKFGYLDKPMDKYKYRSAEYSSIMFDEVTDFWEDDVSFVISRLRHPRCPFHANMEPGCRTCKEYGWVSKVPLRVRTAGNPGGIGHVWCKNRYKIRKSETLITPYGTPMYCGQNPEKPHIPAFIRDNPYLNEEEYLDTLAGLDPITREQLRAGDWGVSQDGRFRKDWAKYYTTKGYYAILDGKAYEIRAMRTFVVCDPAATTRSTPGTTEIYKSQGSWTVFMTWKITPDNRHLVLWDVVRFQDEIPGILSAAQQSVRMNDPEVLCLELSSMSSHLFQTMQGMGLPMRPVYPRSIDKIARSVDIANRMKNGQVWFPQESPWLETLEDELYTWIGDPQQTSDQVDCMAYAGLYMTEESAYSEGPMVL